MFYVMANSVAKLQPRFFLGCKLIGMFPFFFCPFSIDKDYVYKESIL